MSYKLPTTVGGVSPKLRADYESEVTRMRYKVEFHSDNNYNGVPDVELFDEYALALVYAGRRFLFEEQETVEAILEVEPNPDARTKDRVESALDMATEYSAALYKLLATPEYPGVPVEVVAGSDRAVIAQVPA